MKFAGKHSFFVLFFLVITLSSGDFFQGKIRSAVDVLRSPNAQYPPYGPKGMRGSSGGCDQTISQQTGWFYSPNYPINYNDNMICSITIERYSSDVCEVEFMFDDFDIEDSRPACESDYLDFGNGDRICGTLTPEYRRKVSFLAGQASIRLTFRSNELRNRKGFMGRVRQLPDSCGGVYRTAGLYPEKRWGAEIGSCDVLIAGHSGSIQSPGFPGPYSPNTVCAYTIKRSHPNVCKVELILRQFDVRGTDMINCIDFLELPDRRKVCGMRQQAIVLEYSQFSDYMVLMFRSESGSTASGFDIDVRQVADSCQSSSTRARKCDQTVRGYITKLMSPNYPWSYEPDTFCMYLIEPADKRMCHFSLEFNKFELDGVGGFVDGFCNKDFFQLPDGHRMCSNFTGRKTYMFPAGSNRIAMFYFSSDRKVQGPGFELTIRQHPCHESRVDHVHQNTQCGQVIQPL